MWCWACLTRSRYLGCHAAAVHIRTDAAGPVRKRGAVSVRWSLAAGDCCCCAISWPRAPCCAGPTRPGLVPIYPAVERAALAAGFPQRHPHRRTRAPAGRPFRAARSRDVGESPVKPRSRWCGACWRQHRNLTEDSSTACKWRAIASPDRFQDRYNSMLKQAVARGSRSGRPRGDGEEDRRREEGNTRIEAVCWNAARPTARRPPGARPARNLPASNFAGTSRRRSGYDPESVKRFRKDHAQIRLSCMEGLLRSLHRQCFAPDRLGGINERTFRAGMNFPKLFAPVQIGPNSAWSIGSRSRH